MQIPKSASVVTSTMPGRRGAMGVQTENMTHIMDMLAGLYRVPLLAILREYANNAWDAHVAADNTSMPIEIQLPTSLDPVLRIRDYGIGMSEEDIVEIYTQYGSSTKRDTDEQTGMLGIGSKSGLGYQDQFTVVSVKDGLKSWVVIGRDENGAGYYNIVDVSKTEDANGTEVQIQVRSDRNDIQSLATYAINLFQWWDPGTVLVNGKEPKHWTDRYPDHQEVAPGVFLIEGTGGVDTVIMGKVPYPQKLDHGVTVAYGEFSVVVFAPIGSLVPAHNRETLKDVALTRETLAKYSKQFVDSLAAVSQKKIEEAATPNDALLSIDRWNKYRLPVTVTLKYRGHEVPQDWKPKVTRLPRGGGRSYYNRQLDLLVETTAARTSEPGTVAKVAAIETRLWPSTVWITQFMPGKFSAAHKHKLLYWLEQNDLSHRIKRFVILRGDERPPDEPFWIDPKLILPWEVISKLRLPQNSGFAVAATRLSGSYDLFTEQQRLSYDQVPGDEIRDDVPLYYIHGNTYDGQDYANALRALDLKFTLVCLPGNRVHKFKRDRPNAVHPGEAIREGWKAWKKGKNPTDLAAFDLQYRPQGSWGGRLSAEGDVLSNLDPKRLLDPKLKRAVMLTRRDLPELEAWQDVRDAVNRWIPKTEFYSPLEPYPLADFSRSRTEDHSYDYINAMYRFRQGK